MSAFITAMGIVSPQFAGCEVPEPMQPISYSENVLHCVEPSYRDLIDPKYLRKTPRILKMGLFAAMSCLRSNNDTIIPDAIITGTGLGCIDELEKSLSSLTNSNESDLSPHAFANSSHHIVASHLAIMMKNQVYNMNHMHRSFSFENALLDAMMFLADGDGQSILLGSIDEITPYQYILDDYVHKWKKATVDNLELFQHSDTDGTIAGEGSAFFLLSSRPQCAQAEVKGVSVYHKPNRFRDVEDRMKSMLAELALEPRDVDVVFAGMNGDCRFDHVYSELTKGLFPGTSVAVFKHLCGEYYTAAAFATALAVHSLQSQRVPSFCAYNNIIPDDIKTVLIYNHYMNIDHSMIVLQKTNNE
jgi:3-oxoacyl-[acyl-carrier-protein] synthase II